MATVNDSVTSIAHGSLWPLRWARSGVAILILLSIILPSALKDLTAFLLVGVLWLIALAAIGQQIEWTSRRRTVGLAALLFSTVGLFWSVYGATRGAPGAVRVMTIYVIYPTLFFCLGSVFRAGDFGRLRILFRIATALVIASQIAFVLSWIGVDGGRFSSLMVHLYGKLAVVDKTAGFTLFTLPSVSSLMFLSPFLLVDTLTSKNGRVFSASLFAFSLLACLVAGRRAIYPVLLLCIFSVVFLGRPLLNSKDLRERAKRRTALLLLVGLGATLGAIATGVVNPHEVMSRIMSLQKMSADREDYPRIKQFRVLVGEAGTSPVLGEGAGAAGSYTRSNSQPWAYELTYVDLFFQFGVFGVLIFSCGFLYLMNCLMRAIANDGIDMNERASILCYAVAFLGFIAANATNPYLAKFSYMWILFIPVAASAAGIDLQKSQ